MMNKRFQLWCNSTTELTDEIIRNATLEEQDAIEKWWTWAYKSNAATEWNFARFVDAELPELAERCFLRAISRETVHSGYYMGEG